MTTTNPPTVYEQQNPPAGTPDHMTGAELQTLREAAGLGRDALAQLVGVEPRTVKHWEHGRAGVPADVAQVVANAAEWVTLAARRMWLQGRQTHHGRPAGRTLATYFPECDPDSTQLLPAIAPAPVVLLRYRETGHMHRAELEGVATADTHGAAVVRAVQNLRTLDDIPARVVWFDPVAYGAWTQAQNLADTADMRAHWAAGQGLAAQAKPHPGDQPPRNGQH